MLRVGSEYTNTILPKKIQIKTNHKSVLLVFVLLKKNNFGNMRNRIG